MKYFLLQLLLIYLILINAAALILMLVDKIKAAKNLWRIPERVLILMALLGGSLGAAVGMKLFRHKTQHPKFSIGLPLILAVHLVLICVFLPQILK